MKRFVLFLIAVISITFCGFILSALFPSPPDELNELSGTHYIEVKTWVKHKECPWVSDLTINDKQKIASVTGMMQSYTDDDWMIYVPSAWGNLFVNFYDENENSIFSLIVSSMLSRGKQSYFLTQTNGPSISITEAEFKDLMTLLDVDEDCAIVKSG